VLEECSGFISFTVSGKKAKEIFGQEYGGIRVQRVPPTERNGRVHTSTITVACFEPTEKRGYEINPKDLSITFTRGSGNGGQNRNKVETVAVIKHVPTGIIVRCEEERSQLQNKEKAMALLQKKLDDMAENKRHSAESDLRKKQVGGGARGDKRRTIRYQDDSVVDHLTGKRWKLSNYLKGIW